MGVEIIFNNFKKIHLNPEEGQKVLQSLKEEIRARKNPLDRSEHWEAMEWVTGAYERYPDKPARIYSYEREWRLLRSRMSDKELERFV